MVIKILSLAHCKSSITDIYFNYKMVCAQTTVKELGM